MVLRLILNRLLMGVMTLLLAGLLSFVFVHLMPGSPGQIVKGMGASKDVIWAFDESIGWHKPLFIQFTDWLGQLLQGNFGESYADGIPIASDLPIRLEVTASLSFGAIIVTSIFGVLAGVIAAVRGGFLDRIINTSSNAFFSIPGYWLAILLVLVFAVYNPLLPATGYVDFASDPAAWAQSLVLPILAISIPSAAGLARNTRAAMYDALSQEHLRTLRAIGTPSWRLIYVHALRFASVQIIAMIGLNFVLTFGGTVMIEQLFSMPGLGVNAQAAIGTHNIPAIQATVVITTLVVVVTNLVTELLIMFLNPKIRTR